MSFQEERMLKMIEQLPQNDSEAGYNAVIPVVEWEFSNTGDPVKDRRKNIKNALKALKPEKRWFAIPGFGLLPFVGGARFRYSGNANRCVVTGSDCTALSYGELWNMYRPDLFTPYSKVLPGAGIPLNGTYSPQHMQLYHLLLQWVEQEAAENDKGFFKRMKKKGFPSYRFARRSSPNRPPSQQMVRGIYGSREGRHSYHAFQESRLP